MSFHDHKVMPEKFLWVKFLTLAFVGGLSRVGVSWGGERITDYLGQLTVFEGIFQKTGFNEVDNILDINSTLNKLGKSGVFYACCFVCK